jgi:DNA polymerase-3 subunit gamma/tau
LVAAPQDERPRLAEQAARFSEEDLTRFFNTLLATDAELRRAPDPRLHLELGLLKLINARRLAPLEEVLAELRGEARTVSSTAGSSSRATASAANARSVSSVSGVAVRMAPESNPSGSTPSSVVTPSKAASAEVIPPAMPKISEPRMSEIRSSPAPIPASPPRIVARAAEDSTNGLASAQVEAIKAALQGQKFLWSMLDAVTRWEVENGELRLFFPTESRSLAEMLQSRDPMERLRTVLNQVVGQPLRVCVKLDSSRAAAPAGRGSDLRARLEEDPIVRAMLEKFGGQISNVKRPGEEN